MGAKFRHKCDRCGHCVFTSGPWEFYRDSKGNRKPYGHPVPTSEDAKQRGIYGLSGDIYCPKCDKVFDLVLVEFVKPALDSLMVWAGGCEPRGEFKREGAVKCPLCDSIDLILETSENREVLCPRCKAGKLLGGVEWIS